MAWDPTHTSLLATGGRDGAIRIWDLRVTEQQQSGIWVAPPVLTIYGAHEETTVKSKPRTRKGKHNPAPKTVTSILYPDGDPYRLVSSGSCDG
jgi:denticleless